MTSDTKDTSRNIGTSSGEMLEFSVSISMSKGVLEKVKVGFRCRLEGCSSALREDVVLQVLHHLHQLRG